MLRTVGTSSSPQVYQKALGHLGRRCLSTASASSRSSGAPLVLASASAVGVVVLFSSLYLDRKPLRTDSQPQGSGYETQSQLHEGISRIQPSVFLWGRNSSNVAAPGSPQRDLIKKPRLAQEFDGQVLRDLVLSETYGLAVDARGDVLQWGGAGASNVEPEVPRRVLRNCDILRVAASKDKAYALSRSGNVIIFPSDPQKQLVGEQARQAADQWWKLRWLRGGGNPGTDCEQLKTDSDLARGEKFTSISAGTDHLLATTSKGRSFASPITLSANDWGQLGVRRVALLSIHPNPLSSGEQIVTLLPNQLLNDSRLPLPPLPKRLDPLLLPHGSESPLVAPQLELDPVTEPPPEIRLHPDTVVHSALEKDIRFSTTLHEIPALKELNIVQLVTGSKHSVARTADGRVLGFGSNAYGQLGLGTSLSYPCIPTPTEIPLTRCYNKATRVVCDRVAAGGNLTYFIVEREEIGTGRKAFDLLAANLRPSSGTGNGQFGGIGNGSFAHSPSPVKVKTVSGLLEWSEESQKIVPIGIKDVSAGMTHVAIVLDNAIDQGSIKFGRDVFILGHNEFYQLGTGRRSNLSTPQHLSPLPYPGLTSAPALADPDTPGSISSGTVSPMPHSRMQLAPEIKIKGKRVEETIVAGDGGTAVYWRILNP